MLLGEARSALSQINVLLNARYTVGNLYVIAVNLKHRELGVVKSNMRIGKKETGARNLPTTVKVNCVM